MLDVKTDAAARDAVAGIDTVTEIDTVTSTSDNRVAITGSCSCGAIGYRASEVHPLWYCHCRQCRNMTGHYMAAAQVALDDIEIQGEPKWYYVSEKSRHGFCPDCGSQLFWRNDDNPYLSITGGSMDDASSIEVKGHIFTQEKGHYYQVPEDQDQYPLWWQSE